MDIETKFLNKKAVVDWLDFLVRHGNMSEAPGIAMTDICEEFTKICREYYFNGNHPRKSALMLYEGMSPDDAQLRRALDKLMTLESSIGERCFLFFTPRQWLCVYKVFQFLHLIGDGHGSMAQMERMIARIYQGEIPRVPCRQDDLQKKNTIKPFNAPLRMWEQKCDAKGMEFYWQISLYLLQFIKEECGNNCGFSSEVPK